MYEVYWVAEYDLVDSDLVKASKFQGYVARVKYIVGIEGNMDPPNA